MFCPAISGMIDSVLKEELNTTMSDYTFISLERDENHWDDMLHNIFLRNNEDSEKSVRIEFTFDGGAAVFMDIDSDICL